MSSSVEKPGNLTGWPPQQAWALCCAVLKTLAHGGAAGNPSLEVLNGVDNVGTYSS